MKIRNSSLKGRALLAVAISLASAYSANTLALSKLPREFPHQEELCSTDLAREALRAQSAQQALIQPNIDSIEVNGLVSWTRLGTDMPLFQPGDTVTLKGANFGAGVDIDFSKIMIGNTRIL